MGQARRVRISLWEVKRQELPPVDDAFAKEVGDFEDLAALRVAVRHDLEQEAAREADAAVREQLVQSIVDANQIEAPPSLVERMIHAFLHAYEVPPERHEAFHTEFRPVAAAQVRRELVINAVAERHGLRATEAEMDARVQRIAETRGVSPAEVYASLEKSKRLGELERSLTEDKVFELLLPQSNVQQGP